MGVDPTTSAVTRQCSTVELQPHIDAICISYQIIFKKSCVPVNGIEPLFKAYESFVLPLNYTGDVRTLTKAHDSDNLVRIDKSASLNLPELLI